MYPLAMVLGTLVFLLGAVMASACGLNVRGRKKRHAGLDQVNWKSWVLPFLFYGLEDAERAWRSRRRTRLQGQRGRYVFD